MTNGARHQLSERDAAQDKTNKNNKLGYYGKLCFFTDCLTVGSIDTPQERLYADGGSANSNGPCGLLPL